MYTFDTQCYKPLNINNVHSIPCLKLNRNSNNIYLYRLYIFINMKDNENKMRKSK